MDRKKMLIIGILVLVVGFFGWLLLGPSTPETPQPVKLKPNPDIPKQEKLITYSPPKQQPPMTERELQLVQMQKDTEAKYTAALNQLQMLKVNKDLVEVNRDIVKAKEETIKSQQSILTLIAPPPPPAPIQTAPGPQPNSSNKEVSNYTVHSVTRVRGAWMAVLEYANTLFSVQQGDVLDLADGSTVTRIDKNGVILEKGGVAKKISMIDIM